LSFMIHSWDPVVKGNTRCKFEERFVSLGISVGILYIKGAQTRYANASEITGGHWGPRMVVRTIWKPGGPRGPGRRWGLQASTGASKGPGIAAGVLIMPRGAMNINIVIHDIK
jgi:hypothetical protein